MPASPGLLPKWQLLVSGLAFFNSVQNLCTLKFTRRIYSRAPSEGLYMYSQKSHIMADGSWTVTALQSRTFAIWTFLSAIVRAYCAYHIHEKSFVNSYSQGRAILILRIRMYDITMWSYVAALFHFTSEWLLFGSADFSGRGLLGPIIVARMLSHPYPYFL